MEITTPIDVAVIGCIVNGPGEAKEAELGLTGGTPNNLVYIDGEPNHKITNENLVDNLERLIREKVALKEKKMAEDEKNIIARA